MQERARILLVDDDEDAREMLGEFLSDEGFAVQTAPDGFSALDKLADFMVDILVTDLEMPGMSGIDLIRALHARDPECPTLLITGRDEPTAVAELKPGAGSALLHKPVDLDELMVVVQRLIQTRGLRDAQNWANAR